MEKPPTARPKGLALGRDSDASLIYEPLPFTPRLTSGFRLVLGYIHRFVHIG